MQPAWSPIVKFRRSPSLAGTFTQTKQPAGLIIHSSRSGLQQSQYLEYRSTVSYAEQGANGLGWNATVGDGMLAIHLTPKEWGWNARQHSYEYLAVEVAQANLGDPLGPRTIDTIAWYVVYQVLLVWPTLPMFFPMHSELAAGIVDGKSDLYPRGSPEIDEFRGKLLAAIERLRE